MAGGKRKLAEGTSDKMSKYQRLDQRSHVLLRPGMYIGSVDRTTSELWVWRQGVMERKEVTYSPGLAHIFLEVLTNAVDHSLRAKVSEIRVDIDTESGRMTVWNDGPGIDCSLTQEKLRGPELVFGHFLSGSNFDDGEERKVAGAHGIGAKASNAFSTEFTVETLDTSSRTKMLYTQTWRDNMATVGDASIERLTGKHKPYTKVTFIPDYRRFGCEGLDDDIVSVLSKHVVDASAATPTCTTIFMNGTKIPCKTCKDYCSLYGTALAYDSSSTENWAVAVAGSSDGFDQVSFVNCLCTPRGGKHADHVATAVGKKLCARLSSKTKSVSMKSVKSSLFVFVSARIPDPMFDSQNKQTLTTPVDKFGSRYEASDSFVKLILSKTDIADRVQRLGSIEEDSKLKKTDGTQRRTVTGIPNFDDAHAAGTVQSSKCTLVLTEGLSARSTAVAGLAAVGRKYYGVMALKGKPLNPRDSSKTRIGENEEIKNLKKALGLESGKRYLTDADKATMRYGRVLIAADSDLDGCHICALVCNIFHTLWPDLMRIPGFVSSLRTPVVVGRKGKSTMPFYSMQDFEAWRDSDKSKGWSSVYYKRLGLISSTEAREYFGNPKLYKFTCDTPCETSDSVAPRVQLRMVVTSAEAVKVMLVTEDLPRDDDDALELAFRKTRAEDRKTWLNTFDNNTSLKKDSVFVSIKDYVSHELCHYSWDDVQRSLPHVVDGLKESTRKILFALKARPSSASHIRVAQMAAFVGQVSAYRHGEASLTGAIVGMGQSYVGCGHVSLVAAEGQFGTRIVGGKDAASSRYIHCDISRMASLMFPPEDEPLLIRNVDDDQNPIEPAYYIPVLPLLLLNGSVGIGTGWSSSIPCFSPRDIVSAYKRRITGDKTSFRSIADVTPSYKGFQGTFARVNGKWVSRGVAEKRGKVIQVKELPVGTWFSDYKVFLENLCCSNSIGLKRIESNYTDTSADFSLWFDSESSAQSCDVNSDLRLESDRMLGTSNMHALDTVHRVRRFSSPADIAEEHYDERHKAYQARLAYQRQMARVELEFAKAREGFVRAIVDRDLVIGLAPESVITSFASSNDWPRESGNFDYLASMPIVSMTTEKLERLEKDVERKSARLGDLMAATVEGVWLSEIEKIEKALY